MLVHPPEQEIIKMELSKALGLTEERKDEIKMDEEEERGCSIMCSLCGRKTQGYTKDGMSVMDIAQEEDYVLFMQESKDNCMKIGFFACLACYHALQDHRGRPYLDVMKE